MPRRLEFKRDLRQMQVSNEAITYINSRKNSRNEPYYRVLDRILNEYRSREQSELSETNDRLAQINSIYLDRIHELEAQIKDTGQMKLI
jgi:hypothetical protein